MTPSNTRLAGIWIRVSTDEQAQGDSPETHLRRAQMYCELHGWTPVEVYDLSGVSGKTVIEHPEAQRMLADLAGGRITGLIFSRLARLARNTRELLDIPDRFRESGAALISISENLDTSTPAGQLMYTLFGALAEWERAEISARVAASVPIRAGQGKPTGGTGPWGYRWEETPAGKHLVVDQDAAATIRKIFTVAIDEHGNIRRTADRLNAMGLRTRKGALFVNTSLKRMVDDPVYVGRKRANYAKSTGDGKHWTPKPETEWVYHDVPPIIDQEQWDTLRALRISRQAGCSMKAPPKESKYLFGSVLWCKCGAKMYMYHALKESGVVVYRCRKCHRKAQETDLSAMMQEALDQVIISPESMVPFDQHSGDDPEALRSQGRAMIDEAEKLKRKKSALFDLATLDPLVKGELVEQLRDLVGRIEGLQAEALRLGEQADRMDLTSAGYGPLLEQATTLAELWPSLEYDEQRRVINQMFERVEVRDNETVFTAYWLPSLCKGSHTHRGASPFADACRYLITVKIPPPENIGAAIRRARVRAGWSGEELAEWIGVNKATVYHWENGGPILRKKDREKVAMFLG